MERQAKTPVDTSVNSYCEKTLNITIQFICMTHHYNFNKKECERILSFGRDALDTYTKQNQRMDVGSVEDLLNMKGGALLILESTKGMNRVRGNACITDGQRIADSVIDAVIRASCSRSIGSEVKKSERYDLIFKMAIIEEVIVTNDILEDLKLGIDSYYVMDSDNNWIYPTKPTEYGWDKEEFLCRTCQKSGKNPYYWENNAGILLRTKPYYEVSPGDNIEFDENSQKL